MPSNVKKTVSQTKPRKRAAKQSSESLLHSEPAQAQTPGVGTPRWLFAIVVLASVAAVFALFSNSSSFRSRAEVPSGTVFVSNEQVTPPVQIAAIAQPVRVDAVVAQPVRAETVIAQPVRAEAADTTAADALDGKYDARRDYVLALATGTTEAMDLYLQRYPEGFHAELARMQRKQFVEREMPATIKHLNTELKRVGCGPTGIAEWTTASQQALASFNKNAQTKFDTKSPDPATLKAVKDKTARVCPAPQPQRAAEVQPQPEKRGLFFWQ